jgi:hypothetical protein
MFIGPVEIGTSFLVYPTNETVRVVTDEGTDNLKLPFTSVTVPIDVPFATIDTPGSDDPSFESVTLPVTVVFCAIAGITKKHSRIKQLTLSKFLKCIKFWLSGLLISVIGLFYCLTG